MPTPEPQDHAARRLTHGILPAVAFSLVCYLTVGLALAVLPTHVHLRLGFGTALAGLVVSAQYVATVLSRPLAGRLTDTAGPRRAVLRGLVACGLSGALTLAAAPLDAHPWGALALLLAGRLALGVGESLVATGAIMWGIARVGSRHTAQVISWNGITTYGALAVGAPLGVGLAALAGLAAVGGFVVLVAAGAGVAARRLPPPAVVHGERMPFHRVVARVAPMGLGLALGGTGFGVIAAFITLLYAHRGWSGAAFALSAYGACFIATRLLFAHQIDRRGGLAVALPSLAVELAGLLLLASAGGPGAALGGAALTGLGFSLVFPALAVEAVRGLPAEDRGTGLGAYSAFVDLSLFVSGPAAGALIAARGYAAGFLGAAAAVGAGLLLTGWLALQAGRAPGPGPHPP
ncbi:MAG: MFS transporter [Anaeromyxobacter sp.]